MMLHRFKKDLKAMKSALKKRWWTVRDGTGSYVATFYADENNADSIAAAISRHGSVLERSERKALKRDKESSYSP